MNSSIESVHLTVIVIKISNTSKRTVQLCRLVLSFIMASPVSKLSRNKARPPDKCVYLTIIHQQKHMNGYENIHNFYANFF